MTFSSTHARQEKEKKRRYLDSKEANSPSRVALVPAPDPVDVASTALYGFGLNCFFTSLGVNASYGMVILFFCLVPFIFLVFGIAKFVIYATGKTEVMQIKKGVVDRTKRAKKTMKFSLSELAKIDLDDSDESLSELGVDTSGSMRNGWLGRLGRLTGGTAAQPERYLRPRGVVGCVGISKL